MAIAVMAICLIGLLVGIAAKTAPAMAASQAYTWKNVVTGAGGGYVPGIIFNETRADLIYARTDIGGAYRWAESTQSWTQLLNWVSADNWNDTGVDALATDPVDPNRLYLLVGTYTNSWTSQNGAILRSTDQGNTFTRITLPFKVGGNMPGRNMGERLVIDPNDNRILYLGARSGNGLWRSTDFGGTWAKVTSFPDPGQYAMDPNDPNGYLSDIMGIAWITFDKSTGSAGSATQTIYVGVADPNGTNIYRSTNGGSSWAAVPGQVTCSSSGGSVTCTNGSSWTVGSQCPQHVGIGLIPHHGVISPDRFLYVTYSDTLGPYDGDIGDVYKLNLANDTWTRISPRPSTTGGDCTNGLMDMLTGYSGISIDRQNPQTIMVSELNRWWPDVNFWRSTDGGATWTSAWEEAWPPVYTQLNYPDISAAPWLNFGVTTPPEGEPPVKLGWMVGDFEIDPFNSNRFFYGTGATIYGGTNLTTWDSGGKVVVKVMGKGVEETSVLDLVSPPSGSVRLISGIGDIGGFRHTNLDAVPSAIFVQPVFISTTDLDYAELSMTFYVRVGSVDKQYHPDVNRAAFSYDGGSNWFQANSEPDGVTGGGTVAAAANASRVIWSPAGASVVYSTDNGNTWTASQGIPTGAVVASDRVNPSKFYGLAGGTFYVSTNGGANFSAAATGLPTSGEVKAVAGIEGDVWVVGGASDAAPWGMWHSTNSGASFTKLANVQGADSIGFGMHAPGQSYPAIYAAAKVDNVRGIYRSDNSGGDWILISDNQHQYATIQTITGDPTIFGRVYIGTNGLGAFYGDAQGLPPTTPPPTTPPVTTPPPTTPPPTTPPVTTPPPTTPPPTTPPPTTPVVTTPPATTPPATTPPPGSVSINSGGPATGSFAADQYFSGGSTYTNTRTIDVSQIPANTAPAAIFSTERYGAMTYTIPNRSGTQTVTLYFVETYMTAAGQRVFNVSINGATVLSNFDIFASAGGANRAIARTFTTTANSSGQVVIQFTAVTQNPKINGITVSGGGTPPVTTPPPTTPPPTTPPVTTPPATTPPATTPPATTPPATTPPVTTPPATTPPPTTGPGCSPVTSTITVPFTYDGAGTFCWQTDRLGSYINSWNVASLTINGVDFTNRWANAYPPAINGSWYISYTGNFPWSHFEAR